ncbi:unnamed protein product [Coregonus sp. 'balchen']|nr:unnamed protein product [Coregonus sp. 'balchen']
MDPSASSTTSSLVAEDTILPPAASLIPGHRERGTRGYQHALPEVPRVWALILEGRRYIEMDEGVVTVAQIQWLLMENQAAGLRVVLDLCNLDLLKPQDPERNDTEVPSGLSGSIQYALRYWLEQEVAGFGICDIDPVYSEQNLKEWRVVVQEFSSEDDESIVMMRQIGESLPALNGSSTSLNSSLSQSSILDFFHSLSHSRSREEVLLFSIFTFLPFNTSSVPLSFSTSYPSQSSPPVLAFLRSWGCVHFLVVLNLWPVAQSLKQAWTSSLHLLDGL